MHTLSLFFALFILFVIPLSVSADSLSENIATFVAAGRNLEAHQLSPRDIPSTTLDYPEDGNAFSFDTVEQPIAIFKIGGFNLTTYVNTQPSLSLQFGKNATLGIKASEKLLLLQIKMRF